MTLVAALFVFTAGAPHAKVAQEEASKIKSELTPLGGEKAGNQDGSIPAWDGGLTQAPACCQGKGKRYCDPFAQDKPKFTITAQKVSLYQQQLMPGQLAMFKQYPIYEMNVYETRRTAAAPQHVCEATYQNALRASLGGNDESLVGAVTGIPLPIRQTGQEPIWNHKVRYRGESVRRWNQPVRDDAGRHTAMAYDEPFLAPIGETIYDMQANRYWRRPTTTKARRTPARSSPPTTSRRRR